MVEVSAGPEAQAGPEERADHAPLRRAVDLARTVACLTPATTNQEVIEYFRQNPGQVCLPVVEDGIPIGLINSGIFLTGLSLPFRREVFDRKSCIAFMDKTPLVVDGDMSLPDLGRLAVSMGSKVLNDGFIVTRGGQYLGLGTGLDLLKALGQLEAERTAVILESMAHARVIQGAVVETSRREMASAGFKDQYLIWEPRDGVGGDAFFARKIARDGREGVFIALLDCTGHGVPGAFTAMLMTSFLGHALDLEAPWEPGAVLAAVNRRVKETLDQGFRTDRLHFLEPLGGDGLADEGMDVTCVWLDLQARRALFSGARHSLWVFRPGALEPEEIKGERMGVGYITTPDAHVWQCAQVDFAPGTVLMATTDGILDQIGGPQRTSFGRRRLWKAFVAGNGGLRDRLEACSLALAQYQGLENRRDDVSFFAVES